MRNANFNIQVHGAVDADLVEFACSDSVLPELDAFVRDRDVFGVSRVPNEDVFGCSDPPFDECNGRTVFKFFERVSVALDVLFDEHVVDDDAHLEQVRFFGASVVHLLEKGGPLRDVFSVALVTFGLEG